jgi:hypothetical protein
VRLCRHQHGPPVMSLGLWLGVIMCGRLMQQVIGRIGHDRMDRVERRQHLQTVAAIERGGADLDGHSQFLDLLAKRCRSGGSAAPLGLQGGEEEQAVLNASG